ncbi:hypothetical protein [Kineothrix alysoides]|nr:hypothetical protein [Kineothrix alysoides]
MWCGQKLQEARNCRNALEKALDEGRMHGIEAFTLESERETSLLFVV